MKRRWLRILAVLVVIALVVFVIWARRDSRVPRFVPGAAVSIPPAAHQQFDFLADAPFENDRIWIWAYVPRSYANLYLYDLRQKKILGQLFNADTPSFSSRDGSRLLVRRIESPVTYPQILVHLLRVFGIRLQSSSQRTETYWIVDTSRNSVKRVGSLSQFTGTDSTWHPAPDFRHGYTVPTTSSRWTLYLCDLDQPSLTPITVPGYPSGWWDEHDILLDMGTNRFDLFDILTETTRTLFSAADFDKLLASGVASPATLPTIASRATTATTAAMAGCATAWNGKSYDFYFGPRDQLTGLKGSNSFVLRASGDSPQLTLLYTNFQHRWDGHFDRTGKQYLYPGERGRPGASGNGAVYLRDLTSGTESTIVPPPIRGYYSLPRFYGDEVIYLRDGRVRRVGLDGSNDVFVLLVAPKSDGGGSP